MPDRNLNQPKNIVVCCDGTGNEYGEYNSNVVKFYSLLNRNPVVQATFYDPGVGTYTTRPFITKLARKINLALGLAFGVGITKNILDAYHYIMQHYRRGDRVYLIGFSRGAYTARAVAGLIYKCGLLYSDNENMIPYAYRIFKRERKEKIWKGFKSTFSRECTIHFLGLWDTVTSVGWVWDPLRLPYTTHNPAVLTVRQALSVDERRAFFRQNLWHKTDGQDVKQVWFPGVHSDIGGGYHEDESGLSKIALEWMVVEAKACGLKINRAMSKHVIRHPSPPNPTARIHNSLHGQWWLCEIWPKLLYNYKLDSRRLRLNLSKRRGIRARSSIHQSVFDRMNAGIGYKPYNLPNKYTIEPWNPIDSEVKVNISKSIWLDANICLAKAWHTLHGQPPTANEADRFRMEQGQHVGELARELFPEGILVKDDQGATAAEVTHELIHSDETTTLFEATFAVDSLIAKADILTKDSSSWHLIEAKSSFLDSKRISQLVDDLAYTLFVLTLAGIPITKASLAILSREYRLGNPVDQLFIIVDKTDEAKSRAAEYANAREQIVQATLNDECPHPKLLSACRECRHYNGTCLGAGITHTVLELPRLNPLTLKHLSDRGVVDLTQFPGDIPLNDVQQRVLESVLANEPTINTNLKAALNTIEWPCYYLDFETVVTVLPLYYGRGCHEPIVTQYSIHFRDTIDGELSHKEYLADATKDCEHQLAESLIKALGSRGSIIVYSGYEKQRITSLQNRFADLAAPLQRIIDRLCDLLPIIKQNVYHPDFQGSFSIKKVLPALVTDLTYENLEIGDGDTAIARYARMASGTMPPKEVADTRQQLLEYCKLDTLAMVRLHDALICAVRSG